VNLAIDKTEGAGSPFAGQGKVDDLVN